MSVSRNLKLFAGLTAAAALFAGCGGGDDTAPLELRPIITGVSSAVGVDQTIGTPATGTDLGIGADYQVPDYGVVAAQKGALVNDYAITTNSLPTGPLTNPSLDNQKGVAMIDASNFLLGGMVGALEDPEADIYLIDDVDANNPSTLAGKLIGKGGPYYPIIRVPDVRRIKMALRPGTYVLSMRKVPFYPGLKAARGQVIYRVCARPLIRTGVTTFPTKVWMALPAYGQVMDHTASIEIQTNPLALATRAGFYMLHANGVSAPGEKSFTSSGRSIVYGTDGGPALGNPISLITSWSL